MYFCSMTARQLRIKQRNELVRTFFSQLEKRNPNWRLSALLAETAKNFPPLSVNTVSAILNYNGIYNDLAETPKMPSLFDEI